MKLSINNFLVRCGSIDIESGDGLRCIKITDMGGIRCDRYTRPHQNAHFRWDDEKRFYGKVEVALEANLPWLEDKG